MWDCCIFKSAAKCVGQAQSCYLSGALAETCPVPSPAPTALPQLDTSVNCEFVFPVDEHMYGEEASSVYLLFTFCLCGMVGKAWQVQSASAVGDQDGVRVGRPCLTVPGCLGCVPALLWSQPLVPSWHLRPALPAAGRVRSQTCQPQPRGATTPATPRSPALCCGDRSHWFYISLLPAPCAPGPRGAKQPWTHMVPGEPWRLIAHAPPPASSLFSPGSGSQSSTQDKGQPGFQGCGRCGEEEGEVSKHFDPRGVCPTDNTKRAWCIQPGQVLKLLSRCELCQQQSTCPSHPAATGSSPSCVSSKAETGAALSVSCVQEPTTCSAAQHTNVARELVALEGPALVRMRDGLLQFEARLQSCPHPRVKLWDFCSVRGVGRHGHPSSSHVGSGLIS